MDESHGLDQVASSSLAVQCRELTEVLALARLGMAISFNSSQLTGIHPEVSVRASHSSHVMSGAHMLGPGIHVAGWESRRRTSVQRRRHVLYAPCQPRTHCSAMFGSDMLHSAPFCSICPMLPGLLMDDLLHMERDQTTRYFVYNRFLYRSARAATRVFSESGR